MENYSREIVNNVKQEPEEHFVLKLLNETESTPEDEDENVCQDLRINLKKFNENWTEKLKLFDSLLVCRECDLVTKCPFKLSRHLLGYKGGKWACICCDQTFTTSCGRKKHMSNHLVGAKWQCSKCAFNTSNRSGMKQHYERHFRKFACQSCDYKSDSAVQLKIHQKKRRHGVYEPAIRFECDECGRFYLNKEGLDLHKKNYHGLSSLQCDICGRIYRSNTAISHHMNIHLKRPCKLCKVLIGRSKMSHHLRTVHASDEIKQQRILSLCKGNKNGTTDDNCYPCVSCDQTFSCKCCRRKHEYEKHFEDSKFQCSKCNYNTPNRGMLRNHYQQHLKKLSCADCDYRTSRTRNLKFHQQRYRHGVFATQPQLKFECDKCEKSYKTEKGLSAHKRSLHGQTSFECGICGKVFISREHIKTHMQVHNKIPCPICQHMLSKQKLKYHLQSHSTTATFKCKDCGKFYKSSDHLRMHTRNVHEGVRAECKLCGKMLKNKLVLENHTRTHEKVSCKFCKQLLSKRYLKTHIKIAHRSSVSAEMNPQPTKPKL